MTREVIRAFMGYSSSLRIPEFRSLELVLDDICKRIMPPIVRSLDVEGRPAEFGGVPGILYVPRHRIPEGVVLYLHGGGYIGTSPNMYAFFTAQVCRPTGCAVFVADYRLAPEFPYPAGAEDASAIFKAFLELGIPCERIFLAGDSGGGGLANTVLLEDAETIDPVRPARSRAVLARGRPPARRGLRHRQRRPRHPAVEHPDVGLSPRHGRHEQTWSAPLNADLSGFPPTCVTWGGDEMFRDPIRRYVERLRAAGVPTDAGSSRACSTSSKY